MRHGYIHVFQDVDGKLDMDDKRLIEREALQLFRREGLEEGQLKLSVEDGAATAESFSDDRCPGRCRDWTENFPVMLVPPAGDQADVTP